MSSLAELKSIEQQRLADERAAVMRAEEMRKQAIADAERAAREEIETKARREHEQKLAIEKAREDAEREARMRVQAAEMAERARQMMELERERSQQEMDLRKAEIAKKRPKWMLAVTGLALALAAVLVVFTVKAVAASNESEQAKIDADKVAEAKRLEVEVMKKELEKMERSLHELDGKVTGALDRVAKAQTQADRVAAANELKRLNQQKADEQARLDKWRRDRDEAIRKGGHKMDEECMRNPLCKKNMK